MRPDATDLVRSFAERQLRFDAYQALVGLGSTARPVLRNEADRKLLMHAEAGLRRLGEAGVAGSDQAAGTA